MTRDPKGESQGEDPRDTPAVEPIIVVDYDPGWPQEFHHRARAIRDALGATALRIDHIGSTSIPGMAAKPVIDIQVSVASFEPFKDLRRAMERAGYVSKEKADLTKRYFRESPGMPRTHVHVRKLGSWSQQFALLFRDYLRAHPEEVARYGQIKRDLAERFRHDRNGYVMAKDPPLWQLMYDASEWSQEVGWEPGPSDA